MSVSGFMLVLFESALVNQRLRNLQELRAMEVVPTPVTVFRNGCWVNILSTEVRVHSDTRPCHDQSSVPPPPPGKSHIGELAPMALCDIHVAGCGEHLPRLGSS